MVKQVPGIGKVISEVDATPKKRIIDALRRGDYILSDAVAEYVDNAIDAARRKGAIPRGTKIEIGFDVTRRSVTIEDNGGGRSADEISKFVTLGESDLPDLESMGIFGQAAKIAGMAVARRVVIMTHSSRSTPVGVVMTEEWLSEPSWMLPVFEPDEAIEPGVTIVRLEEMIIDPAEDLTEVAEEVRHDYGERYAIVLKENAGNLVIQVDGKAVRPSDPTDDLIDRPWAPSQYWCPTSVDRTLAGPSGRPMRVSLTVGLMQRASIVGGYGAYVYCNGRLVVRDSDIGFTSKFKQHPEKARLRAVVRLQGNAYDMPWTPRKNSLDRNSPLYRVLERLLEQAYIDFFRPLRREISSKHRTMNELIALHVADLIDSGKVAASDVPSSVASIANVRAVLEGEAPAGGAEEEEESNEEFIGGYLPKALIESVRARMERHYGQRMTKQGVLFEAFTIAEKRFGSEGDDDDA